MPGITERNFRVRAFECDANGCLHNTYYLAFMQETAFDALAQAGYVLENHKQLAYQWLIYETYLNYKKPLHYNNQAQVQTWSIDMRRLSSRRAYDFINLKDGACIAQGWSDWVYVEAQSKSSFLS